jgi:ribosomal protein S18 acetylase RimI-like enzyme
VISEKALVEHLIKCNNSFVPKLSDRIDISVYGEKLWSLANLAVAKCEESYEIVGVAAFYDNDVEKKFAYLSSLSVLHEYRGKGIARELMMKMIQVVVAKGFKKIRLEVHSDNTTAIALYSKFNFVTVTKVQGNGLLMEKELGDV